MTKPKKREQPQDNSEEETASDENVVTSENDYADRSPSGFSFEEALHPQQDLKDIMRDLGLLMDD